MIILYHFGRLSLVTLLTNFLILPAQPGVMIWGGIATLLGMVIQPLGQVIGWVAWVFLTFTIEVVRLTARVPFASAEVQMNGWMVSWLVWGQTTTSRLPSLSTSQLSHILSTINFYHFAGDMARLIRT